MIEKEKERQRQAEYDDMLLKNRLVSSGSDRWWHSLGSWTKEEGEIH